MNFALAMLITAVVTISLVLLIIHFCLAHIIQKFDGFRSVFIHKQGERYNYIQVQDALKDRQSNSAVGTPDPVAGKKKD